MPPCPCHESDPRVRWSYPSRSARCWVWLLVTLVRQFVQGVLADVPDPCMEPGQPAAGQGAVPPGNLPEGFFKRPRVRPHLARRKDRQVLHPRVHAHHPPGEPGPARR